MRVFFMNNTFDFGEEQWSEATKNFIYEYGLGDGDGECDDYADRVKLTCPDDHDNDNGCKVVSPKYWSVVPSRDDS